MIDNYNSHSLRQIWVGWDPKILNITKISETNQIIHCNTCILDTNDQFRVSFVYGSNDDRLRNALWQSMCSSQHGSPRIMLCDFNVSRSVGESIGGCTRILGAMKEFNDCLKSSELDDLRFSGFLHTWCNKSSNGCISKKLDRVLVNNDWLVKFENCEVIFLPLAFRIIGTPWLNLGCKYKLCSKLRNLKKVLKTLNNDKVADLITKSIEAKAALYDCQRLLDQQPIDSNLSKLLYFDS
ncbi:hypothetical protein Dsin_017330 [Dipteronia sinensis]|uniref:Endonuclease/exonuclease/phosphatase domain-containing protein n=1 Tax=Dipteronia sinensis TaxID=43782 RepID=A0AAE0AF44_9ROSI|nr:hypothetical protein Dsin_017330 [Dipteronia sinensis]